MSNWQNFQINPLIDTGWLGILALTGIGLLVLLFALRLRGFVWRAVMMALLLVGLLAPQFTDQSREKLSDIVLVLADRSDSQKLGTRDAQTDQAIADLQQEYDNNPDIDLRIENIPGASETDMFAALDRLLGGIPRERLAGVIMITDGQVHDVPASLKLNAPLHVLVTGTQDERDRRLQIHANVDYGIVGKEAEFIVEAIDPDLAPGSPLGVTLLQEDGTVRRFDLPANQKTSVKIPITHAGPILAELRVPALPGEADTSNNRLILETTGVRDRLRVLLLSGEPHPGERAWRNLLRADPGVDLVHFTILRPPEKGDDTPINELALIPFPIRDLFEVRLKQFDLVIFDRYQRRGVLPVQYLEKVVDYVQGGGAALVVAGPEYVANDGLADTILGQMMPLSATGRILEQGFVPKVNDTGRMHPVTSAIAGPRQNTQKWGKWYRQLETRQTDNQAMTVMTGINDLPLLTLSRVGEGRAAILTSDQMWLWQRGHDGGGPIAELLRRLSHWLMKEPALEENTIETARSVDGKSLNLTWRKIGAAPQMATAQDPVTGRAIEAPFTRQTDQTWQASIPIEQQGLIRITARDSEGKTQTTLHVDRDILTRERRNTTSTTEILAKTVAENNGFIGRLENGAPGWRRVERSGQWHGSNWAGIVQTESYRTLIGTTTSLLPLPLLAVIGVVLCLFGWRRETR
ncbi:hypothetical protein TH25_06555 [Thalassospira profundimaris]|uniref:Glutamine amidotransferase domain-containing protein n=1 Tax=Thalassospira profundimaris TaxID=502049 RepID=A0A367XEU0_9PROT|nr:hypothetical protein [Thalassospira profundimaris]RCK52193.1 hypothetical protein TH25_06555 [Thalassospira profundimaris]